MMQELISVVIPTRNRTDMLVRAIESVIAQTYENIEICIVIDGEDDVTAQFLAGYAASRVDMKVAQTDGIGGSAARNLGVEMAAGTWIAFLDDDDEFLPRKLEKQVALLGGDADARHLAFTSVETYDPGKPERRYMLPDVTWKEAQCSVGEYLFCRKGRKTMGFIQTSTLLIPRKLMLEIPFTNGLKKHQDWDLLVRMESAGVAFKQLEQAEAIYHQHVVVSGRVGQHNVWRFSERWMEEITVSRAARDSFLLSIVNRGIATDQSMTKWQRHKEIMQRFFQVKWNGKYVGSYVYMLMINSVRAYLK